MKNTLRLPTCLLGVALFCTATGCTTDKKIVSAEISAAYQRQTTVQSSVTDAFQASITSFSMDFFKKTFSKEQGNHLISPLSAALCLALINNGANGNTRAQIENALGMKTDALNPAMYAYTSSLYTDKDCKVNIANSVWMKENALNVNPAFLQANADFYQAQAYVSPFDQTTVQDINNWCYNHTDGKIDSILQQIPPLAMMYLINAVDFDAKWHNEYERKDVEKGVFHNYDGSLSDVTMLYSEEYRYFLGDTYVGFTKPYKGNKYSFVGILPDENMDVYDFASSLTAETWTAIWENANARGEEHPYRQVYARIPEFSYEREFSLNETLQSLGIVDMFSPELADFSNIDSTTALYCDIVKQKTFIQLDRNGTKAAAITWGGMKNTSLAPNEPLYITLDRPFVYAIVDNTYNLPLFLGAVTAL